MDKYIKILSSAILAGKKRDYNKAIILLTDIICNTDNFPIALLYLGRSFHAVKKYEKAISVLTYYLSIHPESALGNLFTGRSYLALGLYKKAIYRLKKAIQSNPKLIICFSFLGLAFLKLKKPEISIKYFENALKYFPNNINIFNGYLNALLVKAIKSFYKNNINESLQIFELILKYRSNALLPHLYLARIYKEKGNLSESLIHYDISCNLAPEDSILKLQRASILMRIGKTNDALTELKNNPLLNNFQSISSITPNILQKFTVFTYFQNKQYKKVIDFGKKFLREHYNDNDIHAIVAESYHLIGELEKAKNHYYRCLSINYDIKIHYAILQILWESENYKNLLTEVKKIFKEKPENKIAGYFNAVACIYTNNSPEKIIKILQSQIKVFGPDPRLMSLMGQVYYKYNFPELAESWLLRTLKIIENDKKALETLIGVLKILGKLTEQRNYLEKYFKYYPNEKSLKKEYIKILILQNDYSQAIDELNNLILYEKDNRKLLKILSNCYIKIKKYEDAIVTLKVLLKEKPDSIDSLQALIYCLEKTNRRIIAINILENAKSYFNNDSRLLYSLGILFFKEKNYEKALIIFRDLLSVKSDNWLVYQNIGIIYSKIGNTMFAEKFLKRASELKKIRKER